MHRVQSDRLGFGMLVRLSARWRAEAQDSVAIHDALLNAVSATSAADEVALVCVQLKDVRD